MFVCVYWNVCMCAENGVLHMLHDQYGHRGSLSMTRLKSGMESE